MNTEQKKTLKRIVDSRGFLMIASLLAAVVLWLYVKTDI